MNYLCDVYEANKKLDAMFDEKYDLSDSQIILMNIVELCVEIGELANETRCFKYWSQKKASDSSIILEEYADCLLMTLCLCNYVHLDLPDIQLISEDDINVVFKHLFHLSSSLDSSLDQKIIENIFHHFVHLGHLLHFRDEEIKEACFRKIKIVEGRLHSNY